MWDIRAQLGQTTTDYLVLRSIQHLTNTDRFAEGGYGLIMADEQWSQGKNIVTVATAFKGRGIFDPYEWNGSPTYATPLKPDTPAQTHRFDARQDEDWFALDIPAGLGRYFITLTTFQTKTDTIIFLYDRDKQTLLGENDNCNPNTNASCLGWSAPTKGVYYLQVRPTIPNSKTMTGYTHTYTIQLTTTYTPFVIYLPLVQK